MQKKNTQNPSHPLRHHLNSDTCLLAWVLTTFHGRVAVSPTSCGTWSQMGENSDKEWILSFRHGRGWLYARDGNNISLSLICSDTSETSVADDVQAKADLAWGCVLKVIIPGYLKKYQHGAQRCNGGWQGSGFSGVQRHSSTFKVKPKNRTGMPECKERFEFPQEFAKQLWTSQRAVTSHGNFLWSFSSTLAMRRWCARARACAHMCAQTHVLFARKKKKKGQKSHWTDSSPWIWLK